MSDTSLHIDPPRGSPAAHGAGSVEDFVALLKPRVMSLAIFTAFAGMAAAPGDLHPWLWIMALLCIAVGAGASGALNMWYDADIDALMARTAGRPVPNGRVLPGEALGFGVVLSAGSVLVFGLLVNWAAASLLAFTIFFYAVIYTMWLKRWTAQNIVIGGAAGAFPPMVGWAAVSGSIDLASISLFLIIFMWTPPHFWALALFRKSDYERANVPMLPVVAGADETRKQILLYSLSMVPVSLLPWFIGFAGLAYAGVAFVLSVVFTCYGWKVYSIREGAKADLATKKLFKYSIVYLFLIFATLVVERFAGLFPAMAF